MCSPLALAGVLQRCKAAPPPLPRLSSWPRVGVFVRNGVFGISRFLLGTLLLRVGGEGPAGGGGGGGVLCFFIHALLLLFFAVIAGVLIGRVLRPLSSSVVEHCQMRDRSVDWIVTAGLECHY